MNKKGQLDTFFVVIQLIIVLAIAAILYQIITNQADSTTFEKKFVSRDVALLLESLYLTSDHVDVQYGLDKQAYQTIIDTDNGYYYMDVARHDDLLASRYPLVVVKEKSPAQGAQSGFFGLEGLSISGSEGKLTIAPAYGTEEKPLPSDITQGTGTFLYPVRTTDKTITSCFGPRGDALNHDNEPEKIECINKKAGYHCGTDFRGLNHEEALAVADGTITAVLFGPENWGTVRLMTNTPYGQMEVTYLHLDAPLPAELKIGDQVKQGQAIGIVGNNQPDSKTTTLTPHLHLELMYNGKKYDPLGQGLFDLNEMKFKSDSNCAQNAQAYSYSKEIKAGVTR